MQSTPTAVERNYYGHW